MRAVDVIDFCDECNSFSVSVSKSEHDETVTNYSCRDCNAFWEEYDYT